MNLIVQIILETETGPRTQEVARWERDGACLANVGLTLAEGKQLLAALQARMAEEQITEYLDRQRRCAQCGEVRAHKGPHDLDFPNAVWQPETEESAMEALRMPSA